MYSYLKTKLFFFNTIRLLLLGIFCLLLNLSSISPAYAKFDLGAIGLSNSENDVLPIDEAFKFNFHQNQDSLHISIQIANSIYLYKHKIKAKIDNQEIVLNLPEGIDKEDTHNGKFKAITDQLQMSIPIKTQEPKVFAIGKTALGETILGETFQIEYQGCSEKGFCYPKETKKIELSFNNVNQANIAPTNQINIDNASSADSYQEPSELFNNKSSLFILGSFFVFGILLAFTPCVLPMIPILSGIILGQKHQLSTKKAFELSVVYTFGMAIAYALIGFVAAGLGQQLQTQMQRPEVILSAALLYLTLGLIEFKVFNYSVPLTKTMNTKITNISNKLPRGTLTGAFIMGILATLIASPCVSVPLVGAIAYLIDSGNLALGGSSLFVMGLGMGFPLIIASTLGVKYLPHKGIWMEKVNQFLGFIFIGLSLWLFNRIYPGPHIDILAGILCLITAVHFYKGRWFSKLLALIIMLAGISFGYKIVLSLPQTTNQNAVHSIIELDKRLSQHMGNKVILKYTANWCSSCQELEQTVFDNPKVREALKDWTLITVDVSDISDATQKLYDRFTLYAPPVLIFIDPKGEEFPKSRVVGLIKPEEFLKRIQLMEELKF